MLLVSFASQPTRRPLALSGNPLATESLTQIRNPFTVKYSGAQKMRSSPFELPQGEYNVSHCSRLVGRYLLLVAFICSTSSAVFSQFDRVVNIPPDTWPTDIGADETIQINVFDNAEIPRAVVHPNFELNYHGGVLNTLSLSGGQFHQHGGLMDAGAIFGGGSDSDSQVDIHAGVFAPQSTFGQWGTLNLRGGEMVWRGWAINGNVNVSGGLVQNSFFDIRRDATLHVSGGEIRDTTIRADGGSTIIVSDGIVVPLSSISVQANSVVQVDGGTVDEALIINSRGSGELNGGRVREVTLTPNALLTARGGTIENRLQAGAESEVHLIGRDFRIRNGADPSLPLTPVEGLEAVSDSVVLPDRGADLFLLGTYQDGTEFEFPLTSSQSDTIGYFDSAATLRLTVSPVPEPTNCGLLLAVPMLWFRRAFCRAT